MVESLANGCLFQPDTCPGTFLINILSDEDMHVGEIQQFCKLQDEGAVLTEGAETSAFDAGGNIVLYMTQLNHKSKRVLT